VNGNFFSIVHLSVAMMPVIIISTFPDKKTITKIANQLVKKKLTACVNITKISSVYSWKGKIENQSEYLALFKTSKKNQSILKKELKKLHPYDVPEIAEINIDSINQPYMKWLMDSTL
jgi:periplasmic divalent cation tolerance protein